MIVGRQAMGHYEGRLPVIYLSILECELNHIFWEKSKAYPRKTEGFI